jgi:hypothetical protein
MTGDFYFIPGSRPSPVISQPVASIPSGKAPAASRSQAGTGAGGELARGPGKAEWLRPGERGVERVAATAPARPGAPVPIAGDATGARDIPGQTGNAGGSCPHPRAQPAAEPAAAINKPEPPAEVRERVIKTEAFTATGKLSIERLTGAMTGEGTIQWANGDRYEGTMIAGRKHGKGIFTWSNGQRYDGEWAERRDQRQGCPPLHQR